MCRKVFHLSRLFLLITLFAVGCASVKYVGESFAPTTTVDVYFSEEDVEEAYVIMGDAVGSGQGRSYDKIQTKLIEEAKRKGADAVVITGLDRADNDGHAYGIINALFLKYK